MSRPSPRAGLLLLALLAAACSRGGAVAPPAPPPRTAPAFDWDRPTAALQLGADDVASRLGSFGWEGAVRWSATRGDRQIEVAEQHAVRQLVSGEFSAEGTIDPGRGAGSENGKKVIWAGGTTYARSLYPASGAWRERPSDHGRGARRFRDESFHLADDVARLLGPALVATPGGTASVLGRPARRFVLSLDRARFTPGPSRLSTEPPPKGPDPGTAVRLALLDGREPQEASGELLLDAATGAPLSARIVATLGVKDDPGARIRVEVEGRISALGREVGSVAPPAGALPDERRPRGVARALEQAGLRKGKGPGGAVKESAEPPDDEDAEEEAP